MFIKKKKPLFLGFVAFLLLVSCDLFSSQTIDSSDSNSLDDSSSNNSQILVEANDSDVVINYLEDNKIQIDCDFKVFIPGISRNFTIAVSVQDLQNYSFKTTVLDFTTNKLFYEGEEIYSPINWTLNNEAVDEKSIVEKLESCLDDFNQQSDYYKQINICCEWPFEGEAPEKDEYDTRLGHLFNNPDLSENGYTAIKGSFISFVIEFENII